jgi:hypothetical protein
MSTIPIQNLIIDDATDYVTDIGLTSDLVNGKFKTSSLTDLSNNASNFISKCFLTVRFGFGSSRIRPSFFVVGLSASRNA